MSDITYYLNQYWYEVQDPRSKHYPFVDTTPLPVLSVLLIYYLLVTNIIPNYMKYREPYRLRTPMLLYNIAMVLANIYFFVKVLQNFKFGKILLEFDYPKRSTSIEAESQMFTGYLYFLSKWADLFDTFFFALRKKCSHISVLHLYHHISVPIFGWLLLKYNWLLPGVILFMLMNTFIHTVMYSYYALASFGPQIQKYLWWKRYITQIQLIQFIILGIYFMALMKLQRGYPSFWLYIGLPQPLFFFYMFYDFYRRSYRSNHNRKNQTKLK